MFFHILYSPVKHIFYFLTIFYSFLRSWNSRESFKTRETNFLKEKKTLINIFAAYYGLEIMDLPYRTIDTIANYYHIALNLISFVIRLHVKYHDQIHEKKWFHGKNCIFNIYILVSGKLNFSATHFYVKSILAKCRVWKRTFR